MKIRVGIIGSSGGSTLIAAKDCIDSAGYKMELVIVSDRKCGMTDWAISCGFPVLQISYDSPINFSSTALNYFIEHDCENILLYYTRRVSSPLIDVLKVWNIHPALLPAFPGLHAVRQALEARVSLFGATLHHVDSGLDTGPITAQVVEPLPSGITMQRAQRLSYIQKVWLTLIWFEQLSSFKENNIAVGAIGPGLALSSRDLTCTKLKESFLEWLSVLEPNEMGAIK